MRQTNNNKSLDTNLTKIICTIGIAFSFNLVRIRELRSKSLSKKCNEHKCGDFGNNSTERPIALTQLNFLASSFGNLVRKINLILQNLIVQNKFNLITSKVKLKNASTCKYIKLHYAFQVLQLHLTSICSM